MSPLTTISAFLRYLRSLGEPQREGARRTLIFVNRFFYPDQSATSQLLSDLSLGLSARGHNVRVIASRLRYDAPRERLSVCENLAGVEIRRVWTTRFGRCSLLGRIVDYLTFYLSSMWALCRLAKNGDVVVVETDPPMLSIALAPIAQWKGALLINWLQDLFPEVLEAAGFRVPRRIYELSRAARNWSLEGASVNVAIGELMAQKLADAGVAPARIAVIQNWADGALIQPFPSENPLRQEWGLDGKFVVGYSGNLGRVHEYRTFLDAIARLEHRTAKFPSISWLFIGGGALHAPFKKELCARQLKSVLFKPHQPRSALSQSLSVADVHLVCLKSELEGLCVPSKFYGAAAVGRPIIFVGDQNGEIARVLRHNELGYVVSEGDGAGLADRLVALALDPALRFEMGARARQLCESEFDKRIGIARWESLLTERHI